MTYYDLETGERTELSATSFANWVDKTSNLMSALGVEDGTVAGPVSLEHPGHWVSLIWPLAAWQHGCSYAAVARREVGDAELAVIGPRRRESDPPGGHSGVFAASACPGAAAGCRAVFSTSPVRRWPRRTPTGRPPWHRTRWPGSTSSGASPIVTCSAWTRSDQRVLVRPGTAWETLAAALLRPLLGGGSSVVVSGPSDEDRLRRLATSERVTARHAMMARTPLPTERTPR